MIKVFGVGDGGIHALAKMMSELDHGVEYIAVNTEVTSLTKTQVPRTLRIGRFSRGAGGNMMFGYRAVSDSTDDVKAAMVDASKIILVGGFGGGTASGAIPEMAAISSGLGFVPIVIVTLPFSLEGEQRQTMAQLGVDALRKREIEATLIPLDNLIPFMEAQPELNRLYTLANAVLAWQVLSRCVS